MSKYSKVKFDNGKYGIRVNSWLLHLFGYVEFVDLSRKGGHVSRNQKSICFLTCQDSRDAVDEMWSVLHPAKEKKLKYTVIK